LGGKKGNAPNHYNQTWGFYEKGGGGGSEKKSHGGGRLYPDAR